MDLLETLPLSRIIKEFLTTSGRIRHFSPDLWLTYHSYYKAPDLLGPSLCRKFDLPYCIFQGIYSSKQRRSLKGFPGFFLNRRALLHATQVFTNRLLDQKNLLRIIPDNRLSYISPGIFPENFSFDQESRMLMRRQWQTGDEPVLLSAAMFRPDVKTRGLVWLITALSKLAREDIPFKLIIAGDGSEGETLVALAGKLLPGRVLFVGRISREEMFRFIQAVIFLSFRESESPWAWSSSKPSPADCLLWPLITVVSLKLYSREQLDCSQPLLTKTHLMMPF